MRPRSLDEVEGPEEVVGANGFLRRAIAEDRVPSLILWGPPGVGKTTLARLIASQTSSHFVAYSAVATGVKEMREVLEDARRSRKRHAKRTILFLDEIHRFNRSQQDVFLPYVESGDIVLVGATTENPSFELNGALLSRCKVVVLEPLAPEAVARIVERALRDIPRGLGARDFSLDDDALAFIAQTSGGDARRALNLLEAAAADAEASKTRAIGTDRLRDLLQRKVLLYDKAGEEHYNLISALHKSMRESDPDATIYWLVRMLEAGEDPLYVARRIVRFASEDVGLADPRALRVSLDAKDAFEFLGHAGRVARARRGRGLLRARSEVRGDLPGRGRGQARRRREARGARAGRDPQRRDEADARRRLRARVSLRAGRARGRRRDRVPSGSPEGPPVLPSAGLGRGGRARAAARGGPEASADEVGAGSGRRERQPEEEEEVLRPLRLPKRSLGPTALGMTISLPLAGSSALPS